VRVEAKAERSRWTGTADRMKEELDAELDTERRQEVIDHDRILVEGN
jgi:hypothetical protein